ncbi:MAG: DUF3560 domain-containing protein [Myxococcota bacterium]
MTDEGFSVERNGQEHEMDETATDSVPDSEWGHCSDCGGDRLLTELAGDGLCESCSRRVPSTGRPDYAERRAQRIAQTSARAERLRAEGNSRLATAERICEQIPLGQPILVGHHSEGRHRRDVQRIEEGFRKGFALLKQADELERRAHAAETSTAISSDDPEAISKLRAQLECIEQRGAALKEANRRLRRGEPPTEVAKLLTFMADPVRTIEIFRSLGNKAIPVQNVSAERRRIQRRIAELETRARAAVRPAEQYGEVTVDESENRVRLRFPSKPTDELRSELKSHGFRWAPSAGAWQRHASEVAWHQARRIAKKATQP